MPGGEVLRFDLPPTAAVANLTGAATGIRRMVARPPAESTATVIDTADHRLLDWGIELSRIVETGQWVLRAPGWVPPLQAETVSPQAEDELPPELADLLVPFRRGGILGPKLKVETLRRRFSLAGDDGVPFGELTDELSGVLHLGTSTTIAAYWLPWLLEGFKRRYPRVVPRVSVGNSQTIEGRVMDRSLDVGLIEIVTDQPTLDRFRAGQDELHLIVAPGHPLAGEKSVNAEQLASYPLLHREPGSGIRDLVDQFFADAGIPYDDLNVTAELGSLSSVKHLAAKGLGIAIASRAAISAEVEAGKLVCVPLDPPLFTPLEVILLKDKFRSRLVSTFADFVAEEIARLSSERY